MYFISNRDKAFFVLYSCICFYSLLRLSNLAWRSASASESPPPFPPAVAAAAAAAAGCFWPDAGKVLPVCGKPDKVSVNCRPNSSKTWLTTASLEKYLMMKFRNFLKLQ